MKLLTLLLPLIPLCRAWEVDFYTESDCAGSTTWSTGDTAAMSCQSTSSSDYVSVWVDVVATNFAVLVYKEADCAGPSWAISGTHETTTGNCQNGDWKSFKVVKATA
ncbi:uncharacterized protein BP01DRAFT_368104 [Aspergillus saccharolyticus JOP 1030-1]|uniref:Uncharacterized protein n=1 Tax=Aspergillus saccharolyticus JOP 1030-1 TaxID=1450539 RepID=A0A318Z596_9EURO|nr:hypothetical protein BP01DRAFT_368104 [Aspergillus saccharolyticus JOP 1030-1]PYH42485.1 hypothetical protein BP01DRAFT_368104 [Aspergillus saccharolyticus JOP 1030-1]